MADEIANGGEPTTETPAENTPFKAFATKEEFDNYCAHLKKKYIEEGKNSVATDGEGKVDLQKERKKAVEEARAFIEKEAVEKYIKQQNMTEEEKREELQKELESKLTERETELNKREAEIELRKAGFSDEEIADELNYVTNERETSLGRIAALVKRNNAMQERAKAQIMAQLGLSSDVRTGEYAGLTAEKAAEMSFAERLELRSKNPDLYNKFFNQNNKN